MGIFDIFFSNQNANSSSHKADSPLIIRYPMQENDHKKAAFQNIVVALKADNSVAEAQKERVEKWGAHNGLLAEEMQVVWYQADKLGFVPHDKQGWNHLDIKMLADYAIHSEKIYAKSVQFAAEVGVQPFMFAQLFSETKREDEIEITKKDNLLIYLKLRNEIEEAGMRDKELAKILRETKQKKDFSKIFDENPSLNLAIYRLLWLVFLHGAWLNKELINSLTGICMSIEAGRESIEVVWEMLHQTENNFGKQKLAVLEKTEKELRAELELYWK